MQKHDLVQGSAAWLAHRQTTFNASDAPAMMGCSPYKTRTELLDELARGFAAEVDAGTQKRFDDGHRFEALARPLAEKVIGEDLSPLSGSIDAGLSRPLAASFDGITFMGDLVWEHKTLGGQLRECMEGEDESARLPLHYRVQLEQQLLVSGAERALFMASKWDGETLIEERHCWYQPDPALRAQILAGWEQFERDLAEHKPAAAAAAVVVAEPVQALPAVAVTVSGEIAVRDNFKSFEVALRDFLENRLIREPKTDQDFADLDSQIKAMKAGREALKGAKAQMLAQVQPVDLASKTADMLDDLLQKNCAMAERLLKDEKERRRTEIVTGAQAKLREHCDALAKRAGVAITVAADFPGVVKGLKSLASMEDKLDTELARAKIEASRIADLIFVNRSYLDEAEAAHLFPDFAQVCQKPTDDFVNLVIGRKQAAAERLEAERQRIRAEEAARLEREAAAKAEAERRAADLQAQREAQAAAAAQAALQAAAVPPPAPAVEPAPAVVTQTAKPVTPTDEPATLPLGKVCERLGVTVTADRLEELGYPAHRERAARLYRESDFPGICEAISAHVLLQASRHRRELAAA